ncbi:hypothetical protein [Erythrobacter sanguineus]|jgi:hypothetical protein|uniref:Uncharacterized protein n=2 Tax=Erythrobacter sanguineus TaxID=198312 RepID=A0A1M7SCS5_9SPHN|nr:hypothetical protein [Erythrobacter sanguineus]SHN56295.1 hypothetical protein SAMN02745193_01460 [Erythrobacter sanguineus]
MTGALPMAMAALVPVLIGPLPAETAAITAQLCNGGTIAIPLGKDKVPASEGQCHPKACHAGACRAQHNHKRTKHGI